MGGLLEAETLLASTCWGLVSRSPSVRLGWVWRHCSEAGLGGCGRCLLHGPLPRYTLSPKGAGGAREGLGEGLWCPPGHNEHLGQAGTHLMHRTLTTPGLFIWPCCFPLLSRLFLRVRVKSRSPPGAGATWFSQALSSAALRGGQAGQKPAPSGSSPRPNPGSPIPWVCFLGPTGRAALAGAQGPLRVPSSPNLNAELTSSTNTFRLKTLSSSGAFSWDFPIILPRYCIENIMQTV